MQSHAAYRQWIVLIVSVLVMTLVFSSATISAKNEPVYESAVLMEYETGQILFEKDSHKQVIPASVVKMMVVLLIMEKLEAGEIALSDIVTVSAWASHMGGQQVYLAEGEQFTLLELLKAITISSANDAAAAVAEFLAGSTDACVNMMNARAQELGMQETIFANVHGLPPDKGQKENYTTAYDIALLGRALLKYQQVLTWTATLEDTFRDDTFVLTNTNYDLISRYSGADGLKTGFHPRGAGFNVCATATRQNRRLIAVVMGAPSKTDRHRAAVDLLNLGFDQFERVVALQKGFTVGDPIPLAKSKHRATQLVAADTAIIFVPKGREHEIQQDIRVPVQEIVAPVYRGTKFGEVIISFDDHPLATVDLVLDEDIEKGTLVDVLRWWLSSIVS